MDALTSLTQAGLTPEQIKQLNTYVALRGIKRYQDAGFPEQEWRAMDPATVYGAGMDGRGAPLRVAPPLSGQQVSLIGINSANQLGKGNLALDAQKERDSYAATLANESKDPGNIVKVLQMYADSKTPNPIDNAVLKNIAPSVGLPPGPDGFDYITKFLNDTQDPAADVKVPGAAGGADVGINPSLTWGAGFHGAFGSHRGGPNYDGAYDTDGDGRVSILDAAQRPKMPYTILPVGAPKPIAGIGAAPAPALPRPTSVPLGQPGRDGMPIGELAASASAAGAASAGRRPQGPESAGGWQKQHRGQSWATATPAAAAGGSFTLEHPTVGIDTVTGKPDMTLSENGPEKISEKAGGGMKVTPKPGVARGLSSSRQSAMIRKVMPTRYAGLTARKPPNPPGFSAGGDMLAAYAAYHPDDAAAGMRAAYAAYHPDAPIAAAQGPNGVTSQPTTPDYRYEASKGTDYGQRPMGRALYIRDAAGNLTAVANPDTSAFQWGDAGATGPSDHPGSAIAEVIGGRTVMRALNPQEEAQIAGEMRSKDIAYRIGQMNGSGGGLHEDPAQSRREMEGFWGNMSDYGANMNNWPKGQAYTEYRLADGTIATTFSGNNGKISGGGATPTGRIITGYDKAGNPMFATRQEQGTDAYGRPVYDTPESDWASGKNANAPHYGDFNPSVNGSTNTSRTRYAGVGGGGGGQSGVGADLASGAGGGNAGGGAAGGGATAPAAGSQTALSAAERLAAQGMAQNRLVDPAFTSTLEGGNTPGLASMDARAWNSLNPTRRKVLKGLWLAAGYSGDDVDAAIAQNRPAGVN